MIDLNLSPIPNQAVSIQLDNNFYVITVKEAEGVMAVTINRNGENIVSNARAVAGTPLLPYLYMENGNFIFITNGDDYPYYTQFGITQSLIYASQVELDAIRTT